MPFFLNWWRATPRSGSICRINWWHPLFQFIVPMLSLFLSVAANGVVFQVIGFLLLVPWETCEPWIIFSLPTPPLGSKGGLKFLKPGL